jgi:hypothetical protein
LRTGYFMDGGHLVNVPQTPALTPAPHAGETTSGTTGETSWRHSACWF